MRENFARDGQQGDTSVVMTVMSTAFPFVNGSIIPFRQSSGMLPCSHADLQMVVSHSLGAMSQIKQIIGLFVPRYETIQCLWDVGH